MERFQRNIERFVHCIDFVGFLVKEIRTLAAFLTLAPHREKLETKNSDSMSKITSMVTFWSFSWSGAISKPEKADVS
jgi:hypothetical protein